MTDIVIRRDGAAGRITLNRPAALNALTHEMVLAMSAALEAWTGDSTVACVVVDGAGEKAFCAGGDLRSLYDLGPGNPEPARRFWSDEYRLNARIARYPKPYVALMDGFVMGGGVGVSAHGSHRIVTERTVLAMPEVSIGFMPDVGGTWLLGKAPGQAGVYLGLTGTRMTAADAIFAGFADYFVPAVSRADFVQTVSTTGDIEATLARFAAKPPASPLAERMGEINQAFAHPTAMRCLQELASLASEWSRQTEASIGRNSPLSVACAFDAIRSARASGRLEECFAREYRFAYRSLGETDFLEGIRAAIVDRDRAPRWHPARLEDVDPAKVDWLLSSLGESELTL